MTTTKLKQLHSSFPVNPILAVPAFLAGYIEHSGTGTTDIVNYCRQAGLRESEFIQDEDFRVIIWRKSSKMDEPQFVPDAERIIKSGTQDEPQNESQKTTYRRCRVLLETIISKPYLMKEELGKQLGVSESTIKRDIDKLRKTYRITWIGPTIGGRWEVERLK